MASSLKGGNPPSYKEITAQYSRPSSFDIHILSYQQKTVLLPGEQAPTNEETDKNLPDKGKKTNNIEQKDPDKTHQKTSNTCLPKSAETTRYKIRPGSLAEKIQYMKDHAIISKFIGTWPNEKELVRWIRQWWKPKGDVDLQLGSKGFFTTIFHSLEDRARVFDNGTYFYGSVGLHMRYWTKKFNQDKEDFTCVSVWIQL
jgi:hypothetical protein